MGRRRDPARARPPRVRHGGRQPVPLPAALAQRGPRGLPVGGLRLAGPGPGRVRGVGQRADSADRARRRSSRPTPTGRSSPTPSPCRPSTTSCARRARTRCVALVTAYADGLTDDEAFKRALGEDLGQFQAGWLADLGAAVPKEYGPQPAPAGPLPSGWSGPAPTNGALATPGAGSPAATAEAVTDAATSTPLAAAPASTSGSSSIGPVLLVLALVVAGVVGVLAIARRRIRTT